MHRHRPLTLATLAVLLSFAGPAAAEKAARCDYPAGTLPADVRPRRPHGAEIPIDTIVVLMQENRSFDHYFGQLHSQGQPRSKPVPKNASNPDWTNPSGPPIKPFHQTRYCEVHDVNHEWNGSHEQYDAGAMDGFTLTNQVPEDPNGSRTMGYYDSSDLPFYYALYGTFAMSDRFFQSLLGPTFPNRYYLLAATSFGHIRNTIPTDPQEYSQRTVFNLFDEHGVTWKVYYAGEVPAAFLFAYVRNNAAGHVFPIQQYFTDAQAGLLPNVSFVDPNFNLSGAFSNNEQNDEHPPANIQAGQKFIADVINGLFASPQWPHAAAFLTYDEHGGYWDHVPPPPACIPDDIPPMLEPGDFNAQFDRYGFRVPFVAVSPYSRPHYVSHRTYNHTSIVRFIEYRFDLPALTRRDANADPMTRLFKFNRPRFLVPPTLPAAVIDQAHADECEPPPGP